LTIITFTAEGEFSGDKVTITIMDDQILEVGTLGSNYVKPEELCLASALSCLILTVNYIAKEKGVDVKGIEGYIEGKLDPDGFQGKNSVPPGLLEVNYHISVKSNDTKINEVIEEAERRCPMKDTLTRGIKVNIRWKIEETN